MFAEATLARLKVKDLASELGTREKFITAPRMDAVGQSIRAKLQQSLDDIRKQYEDAKREAEDCLDRVSKLDFWPVQDRRSMAELEVITKDQALQERQGALQRDVTKLAGDIERIDKALKEVATWIASRPSSTPAVPGPSSGQNTASATRRASEDWETSAAKRRRLKSEDPPAYESGAAPMEGVLDASGVAKSSSSAVTNAEFVAKLEKRLDELQERLEDVEMLGNQYMERTHEQIESDMDRVKERLDHERNARKKMHEEVNEMRKDIDKADKDIQEIVLNVVEVMQTASDLSAKQVSISNSVGEMEQMKTDVCSTFLLETSE